MASFRDLIWDLNRVAAPVKDCHWIVTPEGDQGREWCPDCGSAKVRNMRRHDRKRRADYILDGGWRSSHDYMPACAGCGSLLDSALTSYGARAELENYEELGSSTEPAIDAIYLCEIIEALEDEDREFAALAARLGRKLLKAYPGRTCP